MPSTLARRWRAAAVAAAALGGALLRATPLLAQVTGEAAPGGVPEAPAAVSFVEDLLASVVLPDPPRAGEADGNGFGERDPLPAACYLGEFRVTYYWIAVEDEVRAGGQTAREPLHDLDGRLLARVTPAFRAELDREGTGVLRDGRVLNVARRVDGRWRYVDLGRGAFGLGSTGLGLEPFVSAAADPRAVAPRSRLYLPELEGIDLPDGSRHAGWLQVTDVGQAIVADRLDVFIARAAHLRSFEDRVPSHGRTPVFLLEPPPGDPDCELLPWP